MKPTHTFEIFLGYAGVDHYWRLRSSNHQITAIAGEGYSTKSNCRRAIRRLQAAGFGAGFPVIVVKH